jgi:hydrogenase maturation factor
MPDKTESAEADVLSESQGLEMAARFALTAGCAPESEGGLRTHLQSHDDEGLRTQLENYPNQRAFLEAISEATRLQRKPYDPEVVKSYWLGGELAETETSANVLYLIERYAEIVSDDYARELAGRLPEEIYLTHLSMVILIASADLTDRNARLMGINHCMVSGGKVIEVDGETAVVERDALKYKEEGGFEVVKTRANVAVDPSLTPEVKEGDLLAIHQGTPVMALDENDYERLLKWNEKVAKSLK